MTVTFDSPVEDGDPVEMTCAYNITAGIVHLGVDWKRNQTLTGETQHIGSWFIYKIEMKGFVNEKFQRPTVKFEYISETVHAERWSHKIRLLHANTNDEGFYWCIVIFNDGKGTSSAESPKEQLDVGE